ncbi:MAG: alpha/beta hydrolase [Gammaproteobacteria bacterium]|nr:alpha/beta hydrolase [Gammaproteobacteria bacterium]
MARQLLTRTAMVAVLALSVVPMLALAAGSRVENDEVVHYRDVQVDGQKVFYREAGDPGNPTILLLHGFPTSSQMFRYLIPRLADRYHVVAPDYPGFGESSAPDRATFRYTFENLSLIIEHFTQIIGLSNYALYLMDYGAPIGFRVAVRHPERVTALIVQNGNAYVEGLREFWGPLRQYWQDNSPVSRDALRGLLTIDATRFQYTFGVRDVSLVSPDTWTVDQYRLDRPGNNEIQLDLFYDYRTNVDLYPAWQAYLRTYQPPTLVVWGKNDPIFPAEGAEPFKRDLTNLEFHLLDTGHFALETHGAEIAGLMRSFLKRTVRSNESVN